MNVFVTQWCDSLVWDFCCVFRGDFWGFVNGLLCDVREVEKGERSGWGLVV